MDELEEDIELEIAVVKRFEETEPRNGDYAERLRLKGVRLRGLCQEYYGLTTHHYIPRSEGSIARA